MTARATPGATVQVEGVGAGEVPTDETQPRRPRRSRTRSRRTARSCRVSIWWRTTSSRTDAGWARPAPRSSPESWRRRGCSTGIVEIDSQALLALATALEGHPDNVAPAIFGGLTIAWMTPDGPRSRSSSCTAASRPLVAVPTEHTMSTALARSLQPQSVPHEDADLQRLALRAAHRRAHPEPRAAARRHRRQAAPELPGQRHARDGLAHPRAARGRASPPSSRAPGRRSSCSAATPRSGCARPSSSGSTRRPPGTA